MINLTKKLKINYNCYEILLMVFIIFGIIKKTMEFKRELNPKETLRIGINEMYKNPSRYFDFLEDGKYILCMMKVFGYKNEKTYILSQFKNNKINLLSYYD